MIKILKQLKELKDQESIIHQNPFKENPKALVFLIVGVSGVGKSTIVRALLRNIIPIIQGMNKVLKFVITHTTRNPRNNSSFGREVDGINYFFISLQEFIRLKSLNFFAEYEEVYEGKFYGTSFNELYESAAHYGYGITDIDINGAKAIKDLFPKNIHIIFIRPQSEQQAKDQLRSRAEEESVDEAEIQKRVNRFEYEMSQIKYADSVVTNVPNDIDHAVNCVRQIIVDKITEVEDL